MRILYWSIWFATLLTVVSGCNSGPPAKSTVFIVDHKIARMERNQSGRPWCLKVKSGGELEFVTVEQCGPFQGQKWELQDLPPNSGHPDWYTKLLEGSECLERPLNVRGDPNDFSSFPPATVPCSTPSDARQAWNFYQRIEIFWDISGIQPEFNCLQTPSPQLIGDGPHPVSLAECARRPWNQLWTYTPRSGQIQISLWCLTGNPVDGSVNLSVCAGLDSQAWTYTQDGAIVGPGGKCLSPWGQLDKVRLDDCGSNRGFPWLLRGHISNGYGECLILEGAVVRIRNKRLDSRCDDGWPNPTERDDEALFTVSPKYWR